MLPLIMGSGEESCEESCEERAASRQSSINGAGAEIGVTLHDFKLAVAKAARLEQHTSCDPRIADVMQRRRLMNHLDELGVDPQGKFLLFGEMAREALGIRLNALKVSAGLAAER